MIRSHRNAHRAVFAVLAVAIPVLLLAGIELRPTVPPVSEDEDLFIDAGFAPAQVGEEIEVGIDGLRFALAGLDDARAVSIRPLEVIAKPDLLVYWTARAAGDGAGDDLADRLDDATLVGSLSGRSRRVLRLPEGADGGSLLVYSLGYGDLLADLPLADLDLAIAPATTADPAPAPVEAPPASEDTAPEDTQE
jgi:hypothetical protein